MNASIQELYAQALAAFERQELDRALPLLEEVLQRDPQHADALNDLGALFYYNGYYSEAVSYLTRAFAQRENDVRVMRNLALATLAAGMRQQSVRLFARAIELEPQDEAFCLEAGTQLRAAGLLLPAFNAFSQALAVNPQGTAAADGIRSLEDIVGQDLDTVRAAFNSDSRPRAEEPRVTIVVFAGGEGGGRKILFRSLLRQSHKNFDVIICSDDESADADSARFSLPAKRLGTAGRSWWQCLQQIARSTDSPFVLVCHDDCYLNEHCLAKLLQAMEETVAVVGALSPRLATESDALLFGPEHAAQLAQRYLQSVVRAQFHALQSHDRLFSAFHLRPGVVDLDFVSSGCALYRRTVLAGLEGAPAVSTYCTLAEIDLCLHIRRQGYRLRLHPLAVAPRISFELREQQITNTARREFLLQHPSSSAPRSV